MAKTPEGHVKSKVKRLLEEYKAFHNWPVPTGYGAPMLDCVGCLNGKFFAIETKAFGKKLTPRQQLTAQQMEAAGGKVFVVTGDEVEDDPDTWVGWLELEAWLRENGAR